jgi:hypothetical protein
MKLLTSILRFVYEFVVGDDPLVVVIVVVGLSLTALVAGHGAPAWWVLPCAVLVALSASVLRGARR